MHKQPLTKQVIAKLYEEGEFVDTDLLQPHKVQQAAWFFISLFLGRRSRENQQLLKKSMLVSRETLSDEKYLEMRRAEQCWQPKTTNVASTTKKTSQTEKYLKDLAQNRRCPVKLIKKYLSHLNPECSSLLQKPRSPCKSFNPARAAVWSLLV